MVERGHWHHVPSRRVQSPSKGKSKVTVTALTCMLCLMLLWTCTIFYKLWPQVFDAGPFNAKKNFFQADGGSSGGYAGRMNIIGSHHHVHFSAKGTLPNDPLPSIVVGASKIPIAFRIKPTSGGGSGTGDGGGGGEGDVVVEVQLCTLVWDVHYQQPWATPFFDDVIAVSQCSVQCKNGADGEGCWVPLAQLAKEVVKEGGVAVPAGFVFTMGREAGSVPVASMLASVPGNRVFCESHMLLQALKAVVNVGVGGTGGLSAVQKEIIRNIVTVMGRNEPAAPSSKGFHGWRSGDGGDGNQLNNVKASRMFFVMQGAMTKYMSILLEAFPEVPWVYLYREPSLVLQSSLSIRNTMGQAVTPADGMLRGILGSRRGDGSDGGSQTHLRGSEGDVSDCFNRGRPSADMMRLLGVEHVEEVKELSDEAYCAASYSVGLELVLKALKATVLASGGGGGGGGGGGDKDGGAQLAMKGKANILHFDQIPDAVSRLVSTHFKVPVSPAEEYRMHLTARVEATWGVKSWSELIASRPVLKGGNDGGGGDGSAGGGGVQPARSVTYLQELYGELERRRKEVQVVLGGNYSPYWYTPAIGSEKEGKEKVDETSTPTSTVKRASSNGLHRLVDADAPLFLSSEVYSEPMFEFDCPSKPTRSYPLQFPVMDILRNWNPENANYIPAKHYLGICRFDYQTQQTAAVAYRDAEVPFIVYNVPELDETVKSWTDPTYVAEGFDEKYEVEVSESSHFMYFTKRTRLSAPKDWKPPTRKKRMTFEEWFHLAVNDDGGVGQFVVGEEQKVANSMNNINSNQLQKDVRQAVAAAARRLQTAPQQQQQFQQFQQRRRHLLSGGGELPPAAQLPADDTEVKDQQGIHYYLKISETTRTRSSFIAKALPFLAYRKTASFFMKDPNAYKGIHCRFGMHGVIAEAHYDGTRNMVAMVVGKRRWILSSTDQCENIYMFDPTHPSARHTRVNWGQPDLKEYPDFPKVKANEVILRAGEVLYVPGGWIHTITNLGMNVQCNARSGRSKAQDKAMHVCGTLAAKQNKAA